MDQRELDLMFDEVLENVKEIKRVLIFIPRNEPSK